MTQPPGFFHQRPKIYFRYEYACNHQRCAEVCSWCQDISCKEASKKASNELEGSEIKSGIRKAI